MYFIDRNQINATLSYMEKIIDLFEQRTDWTTDPIKELALERMAHTVIESIIDVGNSMIDGFIMRDPGSYDDIIDIMEDEKVITSEMASPLKKVLSLRKSVVREFTKVDSEELESVLYENRDELKAFPDKVRHYLEYELGPVSAFMPSGE